MESSIIYQPKSQMKGNESLILDDTFQTEAVIALDDVVEILKLHEVDESAVSQQEILKRLIYLEYVEQHSSPSFEADSNYILPEPQSHLHNKDFHAISTNLPGMEAFSSGPALTLSNDKLSDDAAQDEDTKWSVSDPQHLIRLGDFFSSVLDAALGSDDEVFAPPTKSLAAIHSNSNPAFPTSPRHHGGGDPMELPPEDPQDSQGNGRAEDENDNDDDEVNYDGEDQRKDEEGQDEDDRDNDEDDNNDQAPDDDDDDDDDDDERKAQEKEYQAKVAEDHNVVAAQDTVGGETVVVEANAAVADQNEEDS